MSTALLGPSCLVLIDGDISTPDSGTVILDETTTYASADFSIPLITPEQAEAIDPRLGVRASINLDGRLFDLGIREREADHQAKTIRITAVSDEALLGDWTALADNTAPVALAASVRAVVEYVLDLVLGATLEPTPDDDDAVAETDALTWKAGTNAWDFLLPLTAAAGLRLFCDEQRRWRLVPTAYEVSGVVSAIPATSPEGVDTISRAGESWVTSVVCRYRWTDDTGAHEIIDAAGDPGKTNVIDFETPYPGPGVAAARLTRLRGQGRTQTATTFANYNATPGMEARFTLPGTFEQSGRLQKVAFDLLDGYMQLAARELTEITPGSWLDWDDDEAWDDVDDAVTWDSLT